MAAIQPLRQEATPVNESPTLTVVENPYALRRVVLDVEICCQGCKQDIYYMLNQLPGVAEVKVDYAAQRVELLFRAPASERLFTAALTRAGHNLRG
jgi:copper chaperone CopZ